jgi:RimJ/RimL family protein N-acetyltransferase
VKEAVDRSVEHLRPWMPWIAEEPTTLVQREELLSAWSRSWDDGTEFNYGIDVDGRIVGCCGLMTRAGPGLLEIGYWVSGDMVGRGIATAAARALTEAALCLDGVETVVIFHDEANTASSRIPEKLGYVREGVARREPEAPGESGVTVRWVIRRPEPG